MKPDRGILGAIGAGVITVIAVLLAAGFKATPYNNFVLLADAFRHGRVWIDWPGAYIDALRYGGRYYVIEAPLPAVLLLPAVFLRGTAADQSFLAALLAGVAAFATWELGGRFEVPARPRAVLCAFMLLGTDLFWCATFGDVWFIAHVSAAAFTLLAVLELVGGRRGWLLAIFAVCAAESRFTMALAMPIYAAMLWFGTGLPDAADASRDARDDSQTAVDDAQITTAQAAVAADEGGAASGGSGAATGDPNVTAAAPVMLGRRSAMVFGLTLIPFVLLWIGYNEARWGSPFDVGYAAWYHQDSAGLPTGSPFRIEYLGNQLYSFFVQGVRFTPSFPYAVPGIGGQALTWTSPALLLAFFARRPERLVTWLWLLAFVCAAPNFVYYVNGYAQFGMRHALDFEPYLVALMLLAASRGFGPLWLALCGYSIAVGAWGVWFWRAMIRQ